MTHDEILRRLNSVRIAAKTNDENRLVDEFVVILADTLAQAHRAVELLDSIDSRLIAVEDAVSASRGG